MSMSYEEFESFQGHEVNHDYVDNNTSTKKVEDQKKVILCNDSFEEQNDVIGYFEEEPMDFQFSNFQYQSFQEEENTKLKPKFQQIFNEESYQFQEYIEVTPKNKLNTKVELKQPGETKNLPKGYARAFSQFIASILKNVGSNEELKQIAQNPTLKQFLKLNPEQIGRQKLIDFLQTEVGILFGKEFFGNCQWSYSLTKESKTQVEPYFRYNITYYEEVMCPPRKLVKK